MPVTVFLKCIITYCHYRLKTFRFLLLIIKFRFIHFSVTKCNSRCSCNTQSSGNINFYTARELLIIVTTADQIKFCTVFYHDILFALAVLQVALVFLHAAKARFHEVSCVSEYSSWPMHPCLWTCYLSTMFGSLMGKGWLFLSSVQTVMEGYSFSQHRFQVFVIITVSISCNQ